MKNSFFKTNTVMISSRMNEYLKNNFGYEIEGDIASLREAKASLEAQKRELSADYQNRDYVENMLMLETIKSLLKVHNEQISEEKQRLDPKCWDGYKKQGTKMKDGKRVNNCVPESVTEAAYPPRFAFINNDEEIEIWNNIAKRHIRSIPMQNKQAAIRRLEQANYKASLDTFKGYQMWYMNTEHGVRFSDYDPELEEAGKPDFLDLDKDGNKKEPMKKAAKDAKKKVAESKERPYVCVHAKKGKHSCTAGSSYEAAQKAAKAWGLKSTAGIDAHLADVKHTATESVQPKVDTNKKNYENSYKAPKEYKMKKTKLEEGLLAQLNALLEGDAAEAEITMAARGIVDELQDIIEKLGKIQNDQLGPLADEMSYSHGPEQSASFKSTVDDAIAGLLDNARQTKDAVNNAVLTLSGDAPAADMTAGDMELGGDMQDDMEDDIAADIAGGDEATSGPIDEPLGRAKR